MEPAVLARDLDLVNDETVFVLQFDLLYPTGDRGQGGLLGGVPVYLGELLEPPGRLCLRGLVVGVSGPVSLSSPLPSGAVIEPPVIGASPGLAGYSVVTSTSST